METNETTKSTLKLGSNLRWLNSRIIKTKLRTETDDTGKLKAGCTGGLLDSFAQPSLSIQVSGVDGSVGDGNLTSNAKKLSTLERLKRFGLKSKSGETPTETKRDEDIVFPPPSWGLDTRGGEGSNNECEESVQETSHDPLAESKPLPPTPPTGAAIAACLVTDENQPSKIPENAPAEEIEPWTLARQIQALLSSMYLYSPPTAGSAPVVSESIGKDAAIFITEQINTSSEITPPTPRPSSSKSEGVSPPLSSAPLKDKRLADLLSSVSIMNGTISRGRESVWVALDRLRFKSSLDAPTSSTNENSPSGKTKSEQKELDGASDVMLCSPLLPDDRSEVEIAHSEIVEVPVEQSPPGAQSTSSPITPPPKEKVIWVPSCSNISLQATWWGYRIFLPPPVLKTLNRASLATAKRAALLTTALKWLLGHIPLNALPPTARPAAALLTRLVPLLGALGTFIAWGWGAVRSFDKGNGVILCATWLMPVALIPGTWEDDEWGLSMSKERRTP